MSNMSAFPYRSICMMGI